MSTSKRFNTVIQHQHILPLLTVVDMLNIKHKKDCDGYQGLQEIFHIHFPNPFPNAAQVLLGCAVTRQKGSLDYAKIEALLVCPRYQYQLKGMQDVGSDASVACGGCEMFRVPWVLPLDSIQPATSILGCGSKGIRAS